MEVISRVNLRFKISQGLRRGFPNKVLPILKGYTKIGCFTLNNKEDKVVLFLSLKCSCANYGKRHVGKCLVGGNN